MVHQDFHVLPEQGERRVRHDDVTLVQQIQALLVPEVAVALQGRDDTGLDVVVVSALVFHLVGRFRQVGSSQLQKTVLPQKYSL